MTRARRFVFTVNNYDKIPTEIPSDIRYLLFAEEIGKKGTPHIQGYCELTSKWSWNTFREKLAELFGNDPWIQSAKGSIEDQVAYISKQKDPITFGVPAKKTQGQRNDLLEIQSNIENGASMRDIAVNNFDMFIKYHKGFEKYFNIRQEPRKWKTETIYIYGPTGSGKTRWAYDNYPTIEPIEFVNGFVSGCSEYVLIDDFDKHTISRKDFLTLFDRYPKKVNIKGGWIEWNPKVAVITSNYPLDSIYHDDDAIRRRVDTYLEL